MVKGSCLCFGSLGYKHARLIDTLVREINFEKSMNKRTKAIDKYLKQHNWEYVKENEQTQVIQLCKSISDQVKVSLLFKAQNLKPDNTEIDKFFEDKVELDYDEKEKDQELKKIEKIKLDINATYLLPLGLYIEKKGDDSLFINIVLSNTKVDIIGLRTVSRENIESHKSDLIDDKLDEVESLRFEEFEDIMGKELTQYLNAITIDEELLSNIIKLSSITEQKCYTEFIRNLRQVFNYK